MSPHGNGSSSRSSSSTRSLTRDEARSLFDGRAQKFLGVSGPEFIRRWDAGEFDPQDDRVLRVAMLLPFGR